MMTLGHGEAADEDGVGVKDKAPEVTIRRATQADVQALVALAGSLALSDNGREHADAGFLVSSYDEAHYTRQVDHADHFYVATSPGTNRVTGFLLAYSDHKIGADEDVNNRLRALLADFVVIKQIAVDREFGRQGIAGALYEHLKRSLDGDHRRQIVAAVVVDPPNPASTSFHRKQGFTPLTKLVGPDGKPRIIWRFRPEPQSPELLTAQYERAIELYQHEDRLNWEKLRNFVYVCVVLAGAAGFILESELGRADNDVSSARVGIGIFLAIIGCLASVGYGVALRSGLEYLHRYKERVGQLEDAFVRDGGIRLVSQVVEDQWPGKSKTTMLLTYAPMVGAVMWTVALVFLVILAV